MSNELKETLKRAIKNYLNDELSEVSMGTNLLEFYDSTADQIIKSLDTAISLTKNHPLAKVKND